MDSRRDRLLAIIRERSFGRGEFILASGKKADHYFDGKMTTTTANGVGLIAALFLDLIAGQSIDAVGGPSIGADPIVGAMLALAFVHDRPLRGFMVRKEAKEYGKGKMVEGSLQKGDRVAIIEDVVTTGGSTLKVIEKVEAAGATVAQVLAMVDREEGSRETLSRYPFQALFRSSEFL